MSDLGKRLERVRADAKAGKRRDLRGCKGCREKMLAKMGAPATGLRVLLLEPPRVHVQLYDAVEEYCAAGGVQTTRMLWHAGQPLWDIPALVEEHRPNVVLRWEEHGGLFTDREWIKACRWCYERGVMPAMLDWGYFAHYRSLYVGYYREDGQPDVRDLWGDLPPAIDWSKADPEVVKWREGWLAEWEKAGELGPIPGTEPGYVLVWAQYSANGSRIKGWTGADWCERAAAAIREGGREPVFKLAPVTGKMPVPEGELTFRSRRPEHPHMNHRLVRYAAHSLAITTTATNGCVLVGAPVVSCGDQWCNGLGVWQDTEAPADFAQTPGVDQAARGRWVNYWLKRQFVRERVGAAIETLLADWLWRYPAARPAAVAPADKPTRAVYLTGRGLGNLAMAIPAMKGLAAATGLPVEVGAAKAITPGFMDLLKGERWAKIARSRPPAAGPGVVAGAAALNYPAEIAHARYDAEGQVFAATGRSMRIHEAEEDAVAARSLGLGAPLPSGRVQAGAVPSDMPPQYIAVGLQCAPRWVPGRKRRWPHWQKFAQLWRERGLPPLVFLGTEPVAWAAEAGIDKLGQTSVAEATAIISGADLFIGIDCGLSHVAGAVGTPALVLYGPTASYHTGPYYGGLTPLDGRHPCRACFGTARWETCKAPRCMSSIKPQTVVCAGERLLWGRGRPLERETGRERMRGRWYHALLADRRPSQWPQELEAIWPLVAEVQAARVLEIGVKRGGWLYVMAPAFRPGAHLLGVDVHPTQLKVNGLVASLREEGYRMDLVEGDSHAAATQDAVRAALAGEQLDVLHIDGDHARDSALADWHDYRPLVRSGGLVILHDAYKQNPPEDVAGAMRIIQEEEGPRVIRWRTIQRWRANGSQGPGIGIAEIA